MSRIDALSPLLLAAALLLTGCTDESTVEPSPRAPDYQWTSPLPSSAYAWVRERAEYEPLAARFPPPAGFERIELTENGFGQWLRNLPLKPAGSPVVDERGRTIVPADSPSLAAVVDMDVRTNQQCADVILRLWAEYLWWADRRDEIVFELTAPGTIGWPEWRSGMRPRLEGDRLVFERTAAPDDSRESFDRFLDSVFEWCGTISLERDGTEAAFEDLQVGDLFTRGGSPGHAVIVVDLARNNAGAVRGLILQGYMPAQSPHVLAGDEPGGWYTLEPGRPLQGSWGSLDWQDLGRF
jgi:hypothetical protein